MTSYSKVSTTQLNRHQQQVWGQTFHWLIGVKCQNLTLSPAPLYCPTSHILLSLRHHFPLLALFIRLQLTSAPAIDQFNSTPPSSQTSAAAQQQFSTLIAHTAYYPLCSHLTLTHTACNNTIELSPTQLYRTHYFLLCPTTFPTYYSYFYVLPIPCYQHYSHFPMYGPYVIISNDATFTTPPPFAHTLFLCNCSPFSLAIWCKSYRFLHHTYFTHIDSIPTFCHLCHFNNFYV